MNHSITPLASAQINHDQLTVELVTPADMPAMVWIVWPPKPTIVDPKRFPDVAAAVAQLFAKACACVGGPPGRRVASHTSEVVAPG
jgi:hypothetical protein